MTLVLFLVLTFATWRLSSLLSNERGFYGWALRLRDCMENVWPAKLKKAGRCTWLARLCREMSHVTECVWCVSRPVGFVLALAAYFVVDIDLLMIIVLSFALSGGAALIEEVILWLEQTHQHS
jgi:hypothetical protein